LTGAGTLRERQEPARAGLRSARLPSVAEALFLRPLLAPPAAAMAAVGALGEGLAHRMTDAFFGALQGALATTNRLLPNEVSPSGVTGNAIAQGRDLPAATVGSDVGRAKPKRAVAKAVKAKTLLKHKD
jgi:NADH-quinone oxidoreductase subunit E